MLNRADKQRNAGMPTIVFLIRALDMGGAQRQLVELAAGLRGLGWKVQVMTFYGAGAFERELQDKGVDTICLEKGSRWNLIGFLWRAVSAIRRVRPNIVHGYLDVSNILLACLRPFFRGARIVWGIRASNVDLTRYDMLAQIVFRIGVALSSFADLIICNSEAGRAYCAARGYRNKQIVVVPNGVDLQQFRPDEHARQQVRGEWRIGVGTKLIGLVARLDPMKDHPNFLRAAARVVAVRPDVRFVCVGRGRIEYLTALKKSAADLGLADHITWAGGRADMWRVYNALDVAVSASSFGEGTSNAIAEAMATGVRCAATDVGDSRLVIGNLGIICQPDDSSALANAILRALSESTPGPAAIRQHINAHFSNDALVKRTAEHLAPLVTPSRFAFDSLQQR